MQSTLKNFWPCILAFVVLAIVTLLTILPYNFNSTTLFHMDHTLSDQHKMPSGFVVLDVPGYDGAQYYQIARNIPKLFVPSEWETLSQKSPGAYAYQRILLPVVAFLVSFGREEALPYAFLLLNLFALTASVWLFLQRKPQAKLFALALAFCPAAFVGLHFSLAEPLTIFLITAFLWSYLPKETLTKLGLLFLCLLVLAREVNILFIVFLGAYSLSRMRLRDCALLALPTIVFLGLHTLIYQIFGDIPFLWSTEKSAIPFTAILELLSGQKGFTLYSLSSIVFFIIFVLPALVLVIMDVVSTKKIQFLSAGTLFFLLVMLGMPDHIWSSLTSIGRVITPIYPLFFFYAAEKNAIPVRILAGIVIVLGVGVGLGLTAIIHPYTLTL